ncbi:MAG: peptidyl-prolyl cis-trans isomerase [Deltaproteobacteria bacterium]|nr:peptidyl-prolyl cis-trans isomerase [Deltaproteobacteria bacterium]
MRKICFLLTIVVCFLAFAAIEGGAADPKLPEIGGKPALASVNGEPVTLHEFYNVLASIHEGVSDNSAKAHSSPSAILERIINAKLILQEARNIGLDSLTEVTAAVKAYEEESLRGMLYGERVKNVKKGDKKEIDRLYRETVKEVKVKSVLMEKEETGKRLEAEVKSGRDFESAAKRMLDAGEAKGSLEGRYMKFESLSPDVAAAVSSMKAGEISPLIKVGNHYSMLKFEGVRYPDDPAAKEKAGMEALKAKRVVVLGKYSEELKKKYVKVNGKILDGLDYDSIQPGFEKLLEDKRVVAKVKGEAPVTVADLTTALQRKFFHGAEKAAEKKKINKRKPVVLDEILARRVALKEARLKKLDRAEFFKTRVDGYRNELVFGTFVRKAIDPEIKVDEAEIREYLKGHIAEYTTPEMMRMDSIAFHKRADAEDAVEKLRKGADFIWTKENADGRVDPAKAENLLRFGGTMIVTELPEGARKAVSGATGGDFRIYSEAEGPAYVLYVREVFPPQPQKYESVKDGIRQKLFLDKRQRTLRDWEEKLRKASEVKIYATGDKLDRIVKPLAR